MRHTLSPEFIQAKQSLLEVIEKHSRTLDGIRPPTTPDLHQQYLSAIQKYAKSKGRDQYFNYLSSGIGNGPYVELLDGSVKIDLITGIGINFFGHSYPPFMNEMAEGLSSDVMQGNLQPGYEAQQVIEKILSHVGPRSRLKHGWLFCSGTMSNETALKIIRQKKFPATRMFAFNDCFAGRSTAMQEITDNPSYRQGQPTYGEVSYLPFYDPKKSLEENVSIVVEKIKAETEAHPQTYAGLMIELVQGEGGIRYAPREFYVQVFEAAKKANLAIWADEVQSFGRTTELFAYQTFALEEYMDVVTVGKLLHACMTLYTEEFNPKPGLVAGTFTGSIAALRCARKTLEILTEDGYYGKDGKIAKLSAHFVKRLESLKKGSCAGKVGEIRAIGGMIGFGVLSGSMEDTKKVLMKLFDSGVVAFYAGHDPYVIRILPPFGVMNEKHIDEACAVIETVLKGF
jgi:4-aminobutyrate aminotransferase/(S)-3-amino-2-methylpropionate transaminase